jgi:hypothetical protein
MAQNRTNPLAGLIFTLRGQRVMLDLDLARLYGTNTSAFNQAIKRNAARFPADFAFQITKQEAAELQARSAELPGDLKSQFVISSPRHGGARVRPWAFTEHGAVMAANVLRSSKAVAMSVYVVRAFVRMREELLTSAVIYRRLAEVDKKLVTHDVVLRDIYEKLRPLLQPPPELPRKEMGFHTRLRKPGARE